MDKKSIIGFVLISVILIVWLVYMSNNQKKNTEQQKEKQKTEQTTNQDSLKKPTQLDTTKKTVIDTVGNSDIIKSKFGEKFFKNSIEYAKSDTISSQKEKFIILEDSLVYMEFTNFGGALHKFTPKHYKAWNGDTIQLVDWKRERELYLFFLSKDGKQIESRDLIFNSTYKQWERVDLGKNPGYKVKFELNVGGDTTEKIIKTYSFKPGTYEFDIDYEFVNPSKFVNDSKYEVVWGSSLNLTELRSDDEFTFAEAYASQGSEEKKLTVKKFNEVVEEKNLTGQTDFVASKNKYFGVFLIPGSRKGEGAYLRGNMYPLPNDGKKADFLISVKMDIKNDASEKSNFRILLTPIDYYILKSFDVGLEKIISYSFLDFIVKPIALYGIVPFFSFLHTFIPNYGLVIILFAIILKILLNPLTKKQMETSRKMAQQGPKISAIKEKYKDDPTKQQQALMKFYKEEGMNPMGGCLPMLLQLPILYALFGVFRSTIELRQEPFVWWIKDLASPDVLFHLPFKIPIFGIDQVPGLAVLMGITMILQQVMTTVDPKQKMMAYMMPVMFTLIFFSLPSGLNLYYFIFNLLSIGQQIYTTKFKKVDPQEELKKQLKPKRKTLMERMTEYAEQARKSRNKGR